MREPTVPPASDDGARPGAPSPGRPLGGAGRLLIAFAVATMVGIWGYVMYLSFGPGRAESVNYLDDRAFVADAAAVCGRAREALEAVPLATELDSLDERADVLDEATDVLDDMVGDLRRLRQPRGDEGEAVRRWLDDWEQYNVDRREYADRFRDGLDEPFRVTDRGGRQINVQIDGFAVENDMDDCATPLDA